MQYFDLLKSVSFLYTRLLLILCNLKVLVDCLVRHLAYGSIEGIADLGPLDKTDFFPAGTVTRVCDGLAY